MVVHKYRRYTALKIGSYYYQLAIQEKLTTRLFCLKLG